MTTLRLAFALILALAASVSAQPNSPSQKLLIYPAHIDFTGPRDEQRIGILGEYADGRTWDLSRTAKLTSHDPKIAEIDAAGIVCPVGDGQTTITVNVGGKSQTIPVKVTKATADSPVSLAGRSCRS